MTRKKISVAASWLGKYRWDILICFAFFLATALCQPLFSKLMRTHITVLNGYAGGDIHRRVEQIETFAQEPEKTFLESLLSNPLNIIRLRSFSFSSESTDGYAETRKQIERDRSGKLIGFTQDGLQATKHVRVLLPVAESLLHVFVSHKLCCDASEYRRKTLGCRVRPEDIRFDDIAAFLRNCDSDQNSAEGGVNLDASRYYGSFYMGAAQSGTREIASLVMSHFALPTAKYVSNLEAEDWNAPAGELIADNLHIIFWAKSTEPSQVVQRLASSRKCRLLGFLRPEGIRHGRNYLRSAKIPHGAYGDTEFFTSHDIGTIAITTLLICSDVMSESNAYQITATIREALRAEIPDVPWERNVNPEAPSKHFTLPLHPGAVAVRDGALPPDYRFFDAVWLVLFLPLVRIFWDAGLNSFRAALGLWWREWSAVRR